MFKYVISCLLLLSACQHAPPAPVPTPETYQVLFKTTQGNFKMTVHHEWAPLGADHFYKVVQAGYYKDIALFRVIRGFVAQFGLHGLPPVQKAWDIPIADDPVVKSNTRGFVSFATDGPNTRSTQIFINYADNSRLDKLGFTPFASIDEAGMKVVDAFFATAPKRELSGKYEIDQKKIESEGNLFLKKDYPKLDYIISAEVIPAAP